MNELQAIMVLNFKVRSNRIINLVINLKSRTTTITFQYTSKAIEVKVKVCKVIYDPDLKRPN